MTKHFFFFKEKEKNKRKEENVRGLEIQPCMYLGSVAEAENQALGTYQE